MKILNFDLETTGLNPKIHGVIQIAYVIEIDGKIKLERNFNVKPFKGDLTSKKALEVNGKTTEDFNSYPEPNLIHREVVSDFENYIEKFNPNDKFYPCGYNVNFDLNFLSTWFEKCGDKYFGSWQNWRAIDPLAVARWLAMNGNINLPDLKLETVYKYFFKKDFDTHDALADIKATMDLRDYFNRTVFKR